MVDAELFKKIAPYLTSRSLQFHFQVVGYGVPSGRFKVLEAMIDLGGDKPAITYLRDLTRLGLPFKIERPAEAKRAVLFQPLRGEDIRRANFQPATFNLQLPIRNVQLRREAPHA